MEKPLTIRVEELKEKFCEVINESKLDAYILLNVINEITYAIREQDLQIVNKYKEEQKKLSQKKEKESDK